MSYHATDPVLDFDALLGYEVDAAGTFTGIPAGPNGGEHNRSPIMGFIARGGNFRPVPAGNWVARCFSLVDLGTQTSEKFGNAVPKLRISWEVFGEDDSGAPLTIERDGVSMPMTVSAEYTVSLGQKANLRKMLEAWRGRAFTSEEMGGFDVSKLMGAWCLINVSHNDVGGKTYANVASIAPLPKALAANKPAPVHANVTFDLSAPDIAVMAGLPEFVRDKIEASPEWAAYQAKAYGKKATAPVEKTPALMEEDDIPF